mgnify:CR=1 FL=1
MPEHRPEARRRFDPGRIVARPLRVAELALQTLARGLERRHEAAEDTTLELAGTLDPVTVSRISSERFGLVAAPLCPNTQHQNSVLSTQDEVT